MRREITRAVIVTRSRSRRVGLRACIQSGPVGNRPRPSYLPSQTSGGVAMPSPSTARYIRLKKPVNYKSATRIEETRNLTRK